MLKKLIIVLLVIAVIAAAALFYLRHTLFTPNIKTGIDNYALLIQPNTSFEDLKNTLVNEEILIKVKGFDLTAQLMKYNKDIIPSGRYIINQGMSNRGLISKLRAGNQDPVKVVFNNLRNVDQLAGQIATTLYTDSVSIRAEILSDKILGVDNINSDNVLSLFIPNTYEFYWDVSPEEVISKLVDERDKFWNAEGREGKLSTLDLTKEEVYALASIVEKESNLKSERPTLASVYLNRIRQGIPLQADPTVVFATGKFDLRRVLHKHLEIDSPYNTYKNLGLPPGPIYMPSINSIDAVLQNKQTDYIFFCAKPGYNSGHLFAKTNAQHEANARVYHRWLSKERIR
jgi:UPF0755 protein